MFLPISQLYQEIILDHGQDPRNFGSIIRTAAALGAGGILYPKKNSSKLTPFNFEESLKCSAKL